MNREIDIVVCYHKSSLAFQSDALKPMQLGKADACIDLGFRGDDTGDNISTKNKWYAEDTGFYWLWKNSDADIKGLMHYRRLLDLQSPNGNDKNITLEDIESPGKLIEELGLTASNISAIMKDADVIIRKKQNIHDWFDGNVEEQYKAWHIPEYLDYALEIIKRDFPKIYPAAKSVLTGHFGHFTNLVIMKSSHFDAMCEFRFRVLEKLETMVDISRPEIAGGWQHTARYIAFIGERLTMFYVEHLRQQGQVVTEFPAVNISPRGTAIGDNKNYGANAYVDNEKQEAIEPAFEKGAVTAMMAANNKYVPYASVMLQSIIENANPNKNYDIILAGSDIADKNKIMLESMARPNISVRVIDISKVVSSVDTSIFNTHLHFTIETYYRFFIPKLFSKYEKILYLDCDMVSLRDISDLYETDIGENWWGVARENMVSVLGFTDGTFEKHKFLPYLKNTLKLDSPFSYFQAGVMIWNVKACIKDEVMDGLLVRLKDIGKPHYVDQDVMNSLANGKHIHWLSQKWNIAWCIPFYWLKGSGTEAFKTAMNLLEKPFILHYCSDIKPWTALHLPYSHYFWQYARKTPFYEIIFRDAMQSTGHDDKNLKKLKFKVWKYKILQCLTFGVIKSFQRKKSHYRNKIKEIE